MPKGKVQKRDNIKSTDSIKSFEIDDISPIDKGKDFIKANET